MSINQIHEYKIRTLIETLFIDCDDLSFKVEISTSINSGQKDKIYFAVILTYNTTLNLYKYSNEIIESDSLNNLKVKYLSKIDQKIIDIKNGPIYKIDQQMKREQNS